MQSSKQQQALQQAERLHYLLGLFLYHEHGGNMLLRNVTEPLWELQIKQLLTDSGYNFTPKYQRRVCYLKYFCGQHID
jgi:hypothetical protein